MHEPDGTEDPAAPAGTLANTLAAGTPGHPPRHLDLYVPPAHAECCSCPGSCVSLMKNALAMKAQNHNLRSWSGVTAMQLHVGKLGFRCEQEAIQR